MCVVADTVRRALDTHFIILSWVHSDISQYQAAGLGGINEMLKADAHLCISRSNEESVKAVCPEAITYLTGNPVHMQTFVGKDPGVNTMCYVGRLQDVKRVDVILEALYRARHKWKFKIVGSGESEDELKEINSLVGSIRRKVNDGTLTLKRNIDYGQARNFIGGLFIAVPIITLCNIYCIYYSQYGIIEDTLFGINFVFILILLFHKSIIKKFADEYARMLFDDYITQGRN
jgi:hypothetical protein